MKKIFSAVLVLAVSVLLSAKASASSCTGYRISNECLPAENILDGNLGSKVIASGVGVTTSPVGVAITYGLSVGSQTWSPNTLYTSTMDASGNLSIGGAFAAAGGITGPIVFAPYLAGTSTITTTGAAQFGTTVSAAGKISANLGLSVSGGAFTPYVRTKSQLTAISPAVGNVYSCSDCTNSYTLVIGTGTSPNQFREVGTSTGVQ